MTKLINSLTIGYQKEKMELLKLNSIPYVGFYEHLTIHAIENELDLEEKLKIIDFHSEGKGSKIYNVLLKWENEKDLLPKDYTGTVKNISRKAWVKRNNDNIFYLDDGQYSLFSKNHSLSIKAGVSRNKNVYCGEIVINQWFHDLLNQLIKQELVYRNSIDPVKINIKKLNNYYENYNGDVFGINDLNDFYFNSLELTMEQLEKYIKMFEELIIQIEILKNKFK